MVLGLFVRPAEQDCSQREPGHRHDEEATNPDRQPLVPAPSGSVRWERLPVARHRLVGEPVFEVLGQCTRGGVAVLGLQRHRLEADRLEGRGDTTAIRRGGGISPRRNPAIDLDEVAIGTATGRSGGA